MKWGRRPEGQADTWWARARCSLCGTEWGPERQWDEFLWTCPRQCPACDDRETAAAKRVPIPPFGDVIAYVMDQWGTSDEAWASAWIMHNSGLTLSWRHDLWVVRQNAAIEAEIAAIKAETAAREATQ